VYLLGSGYEKRERGKEFPMRFDRLLLWESIKNTLISRNAPSESDKNIAPTPVNEKEVQIEVEAHVPQKE